MPGEAEQGALHVLAARSLHLDAPLLRAEGGKFDAAERRPASPRGCRGGNLLLQHPATRRADGVGAGRGKGVSG